MLQCFIDFSICAGYIKNQTHFLQFHQILNADDATLQRWWSCCHFAWPQLHACASLGWEWVWYEIQGNRIFYTTSMLRRGSIHGHCAKRCNQSWWIPHRTPQARCWRQRGSGPFFLGRRIKIILRGLTWLRVILRGLTWLRKRRDGAIGFSWESFNACFSSISSADDQSCNWKDACNYKQH